MEIVPVNSIKISDVISALKSGGLIIAPSDTVYGLLVDARSEQAVRKLIAFKNRPAGKPISVFVSDFTMMRRYADISKKQEGVLKQLLPGPFTVVLDSRHRVSKLLESERGTLGLRYPDNDFITSLVRTFKSPLTATSANLSGSSPHYSVESLLHSLTNAERKLIDLVIDAGRLPHNKPSTIVDLTTPTVKILRHGDIVFSDVRTFESFSPNETKKIARFLFEKNRKELAKRPLVFIIQGDLGVGKTIFVKGIAESLGIDSIVSPTFVIYYEYPVRAKNLHYLYHFDLYNIHDKEELQALKINSLLGPEKLFCFEWGEKTGGIVDELKDKAETIYVRMKYIDGNKRKIKIFK